MFVCNGFRDFSAWTFPGYGGETHAAHVAAIRNRVRFSGEPLQQELCMKQPNSQNASLLPCSQPDSGCLDLCENELRDIFGTEEDLSGVMITTTPRLLNDNAQMQDFHVEGDFGGMTCHMKIAGPSPGSGNKEAEKAKKKAQEFSNAIPTATPRNELPGGHDNGKPKRSPVQGAVPSV